MNKYYLIALLFFLVSCSSEPEAPKYLADDICSGKAYDSFILLTSECPLPMSDYGKIDDWNNNGQFDYKSTFFGYYMVGLAAKFQSNDCPWKNGCVKNITIRLNKGQGLKNTWGHKLASFNNIKNDLSLVCGTNWQPYRSSSQYPQRSQGRYDCDIEDNIKNNSIDITFFQLKK